VKRRDVWSNRATPFTSALATPRPANTWPTISALACNTRCHRRRVGDADVAIYPRNMPEHEHGEKYFGAAAQADEWDARYTGRRLANDDCSLSVRATSWEEESGHRPHLSPPT